MVIGILNSTLSNDKKKKWSSEPTIKNETEPKSLTSRKNILILKSMKKTFLKTGLVLVVALLAISCSKDGETGPAGPAGANGTNGTNGIDGNANVYGSNTVQFAASNWTSQFGGTWWTSSITNVSSITQTIVDRGIVLVFRKYTDNGQTVWAPLPDVNTNINLSYEFGVGTIYLIVQSTNAVAISNPSAITLRYVVISPSNKMANPNTDWNDYNQVKEALHLQD